MAKSKVPTSVPQGPGKTLDPRTRNPKPLGGQGTWTPPAIKKTKGSK